MGLFSRNNNKAKINRQEVINTLDKKTQETIKVNDDFSRGFEQGFPFFEKGEEFRKNKEYDKALEQYDLARSKGYAAPALYRGYVRVYKQLKEYEKAIACIDEAIAYDKKYNFNSAAFENLIEEKEKLLDKLKKQ